MSCLQEVQNLIDIGKRIIIQQDWDTLKENANLKGDTFSGKMSRMGSEFSKWYAMQCVLPPRVVQAINDGDLYVHDLDQYALGTTNCIFIPFDRLLAKGFSTGNGSVRTPQTIMSAMALVAIIFQSQQNSQYGGVSASKIDWDLAPYVVRSFRKHFHKATILFHEDTTGITSSSIHMTSQEAQETCPKSFSFASEETIKETYQAAESLIHNLNTMSSRAGGQIPFTSLNYGLCTSAEGRLIIRALLQATIRGLGHGETPIFPQHIFQCKHGINQAHDDPNFDLFQLAITCCSQRMHPNFVNVDASFNIPYYDATNPDTIIGTMGCRTRTIADRFGYNHQSGKGNLSFNTINLVKLGIACGVSKGHTHCPNMDEFYQALDQVITIAVEGLLHRYQIQAAQPAVASDFMMREGVWEHGETLKEHESVENLLKHGTLSIGFIGLAECMVAMFGKHHGEDEEVYRVALDIIQKMRNSCDQMSELHQMNISLFATPAEGLAGKFTSLDREKYGVIRGVTDRKYYTNSFHIPVYYTTTIERKIKLEAPFHRLCNGGAISYIELDGNARSNVIAMQKIVQFALKEDIGYFSINHPIDRCPSCSYEGVIGSNCPSCGVSETIVHFERLRRVTGYLTGDYTVRFNTAKQAEVDDRVKHS